MAGTEIVQSILEKNAESLQSDKKKQVTSLENSDQKDKVEQNGTHEMDAKTESMPDVSTLHPVAAIQVCIYGFK